MAGPVPPVPPAAPDAASPPPWAFRHRSLLIVALAAALVAWPWARHPLDLLTGLAGLALVAAGVALRVWCVRQLGGAAHKRSSAKAVALVTWGPYAWTRNPIYVANMLLYIGFGVLAGVLWALPALAGAMWLQYAFTVRYEEGFLRAAFGEAFDDYCRETPRWLPVPRRRPSPEGFTPYTLRKVLKRERSLFAFQIPGGLALVFLLRLVLPAVLDAP